MITIIILVGRDQNNLKRLYLSILQLTKLPKEIILVVDQEAVLNFQETEFLIQGVNLIFLYTKNKKLPEMRNVGIQSASSDFIWFIDDDVTLNSDSIDVLDNILIELDETIGCVAGRIIESKDFTHKLKRPIDFTFFRGFIGDFTLERSEFPLSEYKIINFKDNLSFPIVPFAQGTSMVFNKTHLISIGGFDEDLSYGYCSFEDADPCLALYRKGYKTIFASDVSLVHHKMMRIGGVTRGHDNFLYQSSIIRNFMVVIYKNKYPNLLLWPVYILTFTFFHFIRLLYSNDFLKFNFNSIDVLSKSIKAVISGFYLGILVIFNNNSRVNSQINK